MTEPLRRLRWRLARLFAPVPIIIDPLPGYVGAFIVMRYEGNFVVTVKAATLDLNMASTMPTLADIDSADPTFHRHSTTGQFSGTIVQ